jgi:TonB family protein
MPLVFFICAPVWAQSDSAPAVDSGSKAQATQPAQTPSDSDKTSLPDPTAPAPLADSTKVEPIKVQKAKYPYEARAQQLQGEVVVKVVVSETGDVQSAEVVSGDPILAQSAVDAAKKWKFKPFIKNGKPVKVSTRLPFDFAFTDKVSDEKEPTPAGNPDTQPNSPNAAAPQRVRVSQGVTTGLLLHKVSPVYPEDARRARIQGTVVLRARISKEGRIVDLQLVSGPEELVKAAMGAVQQWRYRPYLLLGDPVEVDTEIQVNFRLQ